jgi:ABC-type lipoprotein export system ATPase subunit
MSAVVRIDDAFRIYDSGDGGTVALQGLTLEVEECEIVVVFGPSGSGKSTLMRVLSGLEPLSAGTARVLGTEVTRIGSAAAAAFRARNLGLLDQHYARSLSPDLTCRQTVALQLELLGHGPVDSRTAATALLERVGLGDRAGDRPATLSGGEQQRVAVCAAVAHRPRLLLADEPAGELDAGNAAVIYRMLGELVREAGGAAVIVSHDAAATSIADRILVVRDGRVVEEARPGRPRSLVVARGWLRLPEALLRDAGAPGLVTAETLDGSIVLHPAAGTELPSVERVARPAAAQGLPVVAELDAVGKRHGARVVLDGVSRRFEAGVLTALVGRSGSGKTTLLHLLAGLERPTAGAVTVAGTSLGELGRAELAELRRRHVALVTQEPGLVSYLTGLENVRLGLSLRGGGDKGSRDEAQAAREALVEVGLERRLDLPVGRLSAGERQRVAIARALAADVELLLVDEPTARLDEENARLCGELLAGAAHERNLAVVCATHDPVLIEAADDVMSFEES